MLSDRHADLYREVRRKTEVVEHGRAESDWRRSSLRRLRRLLARINYGPAFTNAPGRDALPRYGHQQGHHDLAETVAAIRNVITHPKPEHDLYAHDVLLLQAWRHATIWLELAILHRLAYPGHVVDRTVPGGWVGDSRPVPWTDEVNDNHD